MIVIILLAVTCDSLTSVTVTCDYLTSVTCNYLTSVAYSLQSGTLPPFISEVHCKGKRALRPKQGQR